MVVCRMTLMVCKKKRSKIEIEKKTKWWKLKKEECCEELRQKFRKALGGQVVLPDDWETTAEVIRETGRKVLGVSSGRRKEDKETWWWNEEVQDSIQRKRLAKKKWDRDRTEENRQKYKESQCRVKREVSKAKQKAYDELYTSPMLFTLLTHDCTPKYGTNLLVKFTDDMTVDDSHTLCGVCLRVEHVQTALEGAGCVHCKVKLWATAKWEWQSAICTSYDAFSRELRKVFDTTVPQQGAMLVLFEMCQGSRSVTEYAVEFHPASVNSGWNVSTLHNAFYHRLATEVKDELTIRELPSELDKLITLASHIDPSSLGSCHRRAPSSSIPTDYHDLGMVFCKARASLLPPHCPYTCSIDLLPGTLPPRGCLYHLTMPEMEAMNTYIRESIIAGIISPSSSPAGVGFFFIEKKAKTLCACIDYWGLNVITVKNRYPLPLMSSAFELLQGATVFTKLYLWNAYHLGDLTRDKPAAQFNSEGCETILSYRLGSKNSKPDALSHQFNPDEEELAVEHILPSSVMVRALQLDIKKRVQQAAANLPDHLRSLQWCHGSHLFCHPSVSCTRSILQQQFWWISVGKDVQNFVAACPTCTQQKSPKAPPAGYLHPMPVPW
ncbi:hypothetical protein QTP70_008929 [Hemibagrus guttatus]|uniref:Integrase zinc-binding domain-containing protein n=1 Tax=Hemibagrus guttatus TaxID=175788 RepID=A0AAE0URG8_9TELE|nr:hypothetical protein QTP70_008929 [Hemibagrus guttatus]